MLRAADAVPGSVVGDGSSLKAPAAGPTGTTAVTGWLVLPGGSVKVARGRGLCVDRAVRRGLGDAVGLAVRVGLTETLGLGDAVGELEGLWDGGIGHGLANGHTAASDGATTPGPRLSATDASRVADADSSRTRRREAAAGTATMVGAPRAVPGTTCRAYSHRMAGWVEDVLTAVPPWAVYVAVFALPFLEASVFLGFVFPGETALVFGGVLAHQGHASLGVVVLLAVVGAITGDAVGYGVGRRWGRRLQRSRVGRKVGQERWRTTETFLHRRGSSAVFFGRWTALLRAMVPSAAGMAKLPYRRFALWNALGGTLWAVTCVVGGYLLGDVVSRYVADLGWVIAGIVVVLVVTHVVRSRRERSTSGRSGR